MCYRKKPSIKNAIGFFFEIRRQCCRFIRCDIRTRLFPKGNCNIDGVEIVKYSRGRDKIKENIGHCLIWQALGMLPNETTGIIESVNHWLSI